MQDVVEVLEELVDEGVWEDMDEAWFEWELRGRRHRHRG